MSQVALDVTAVILSYWPQRHANVKKSFDMLTSGTIVPRTTIVMSNNGSSPLPMNPFGKFVTLNSSHNFWTRGKYAAALMEPSPYYLLMDDDIAVGPRTLEAFLMNAEDEWTCFAGRCVDLDNSGSFWHGTSWSPNEVTSPRQTDTMVGRIQFVSFESILRMFRWEPKIRFPRLLDEVYRYKVEDVAMGLCNYTKVLPLRDDECPVDLSECGTSLCEVEKDYSEFRDEYCRSLQNILWEAYTNDDFDLPYDPPWIRRAIEEKNYA